LLSVLTSDLRALAMSTSSRILPLAAAAVSTLALSLSTILGRATAGAAAPPALVPLLLPGSRDLLLRPFGARTQRIRVSLRTTATDTTEQQLALVRDERPADSAGRWILAYRYAPPVVSEDSLVVDGAGLAPRTERFRNGDVTATFEYFGSRVRGTIQRGDAAPETFQRDFAEAPFSSNEIGAIVRSLRYRAGDVMVLPVFSTMTAAVSYDTISVLRAVRVPRGALGGERVVWLVRFVEPTAALLYFVDDASREILRQDIVHRATGGRARLVPDEERPDSTAPPGVPRPTFRASR
jgi:hypothetical protein